MGEWEQPVTIAYGKMEVVYFSICVPNFGRLIDLRVLPGFSIGAEDLSQPVGQGVTRAAS